MRRYVYVVIGLGLVAVIAVGLAQKKGSVAPEGYDDLIKRYYEELIK